ncbi:MAG: class I SAM-dependent methyltransferase [Methyloligellaceae bacterium]
MNKTLVKSQFGRSAQNYAVSPVHAKGASLARMVELAAPEADWQVLDIATGAGHTALAFAPHVARVVATDITAEMLEVAANLARERDLANVAFEEADAEALKFPDASFDLVTCRIAPHHFGHVDRFVAEAHRVLRPGGLFILVDNIAPDRHTTEGFADEALSAAASDYNRFEKIRDPGHARALALGEWLELLAAAGFEVPNVEILGKDMEFEPWADRIHADAEAKAELRRIADEASPALQAFLRPRQEDGALWMTWAEGLLVGRKRD